VVRCGPAVVCCGSSVGLWDVVGLRGYVVGLLWVCCGSAVGMLWVCCGLVVGLLSVRVYCLWVCGLLWSVVGLWYVTGMCLLGVCCESASGLLWVCCGSAVGLLLVCCGCDGSAVGVVGLLWVCCGSAVRLLCVCCVYVAYLLWSGSVGSAVGLL
jgi:hypothetical protein